MASRDIPPEPPPPPKPQATPPPEAPPRNGELRTDQLVARPPGGPTEGWQAVVYQLSGGRVRPEPGTAERNRQQLAARIGTPVAG